MVSANLDLETARRAVTMSVEDAHAIVEDACTALNERRALRQRRGGGVRVLRCGGCHRFRSSTGGRCGCGYDQHTGWAA